MKPRLLAFYLAALTIFVMSGPVQPQSAEAVALVLHVEYAFQCEASDKECVPSLCDVAPCGCLDADCVEPCELVPCQCLEEECIDPCEIVPCGLCQDGSECDPCENIPCECLEGGCADPCDIVPCGICDEGCPGLGGISPPPDLARAEVCDYSLGELGQPLEPRLCAFVAAGLERVDDSNCSGPKPPGEVCAHNFNYGGGWSVDTRGEAVVNSAESCEWPNSYNEHGCSTAGDPHFHWHSEEEMRQTHTVTSHATDDPPLEEFRSGSAYAILHYNEAGVCPSDGCGS